MIVWMIIDLKRKGNDFVFLVDASNGRCHIDFYSGYWLQLFDNQYEYILTSLLLGVD